jgi:hypothetical protein
VPRQLADVPVPGDTHFREDKQVNVLRMGVRRKGTNLIHVLLFVARLVIELYRCGSDVFHGVISLPAVNTSVMAIAVICEAAIDARCRTFLPPDRHRVNKGTNE